MAGRCAGQHVADHVEVQGKVGPALALDHRGPGQVGDVGVQGVGGLEHRHRPARAAVGQAQRLQHLVGAVGAEDLLGADAVQVGQGGPQLGRVAVGIAVPLDPAQLVAAAPRSRPAGGGSGDSLVLSRTSTSTCGEW